MKQESALQHDSALRESASILEERDQAVLHYRPNARIKHHFIRGYWSALPKGDLDAPLDPSRPTRP
jgi:hypothetical protein